jgi:hypothetical protein
MTAEADNNPADRTAADQNGAERRVVLRKTMDEFMTSLRWLLLCCCNA